MPIQASIQRHRLLTLDVTPTELFGCSFLIPSLSDLMRFLTQSRSGSQSSWRTVGLGLFSLLFMLVVTYCMIMGEPRLAITLAVSMMLVTLAVIDIRLSIIVTLCYLVFLGDLRRLLIPLIGWTGNDPLLLIGPLFATVLFAYAWASKALSLDTSLAKWMTGLMAIMVVQMFNPQQGGLMVGIAGAVFYLVPLFWFWIGRSYATPALIRSLFSNVLVPLALAAGVFGLYQVLVGYLPYQLEWYDISGYSGLGPSVDRLKPISFFTSSTENAKFLSIAALIVWTRVLIRKDYGRLLFFGFLFLSVFLVGSRGPVVKLILVAAGLWAIMGDSVRSWTIRTAIAAVIGLIGLVAMLSQLQDVEFTDPTLQHYNQRQAELLTPEETTGGLHITMMFWGIERGFANPLGRGLGSTTLAASKFGTGRWNSEVDFSNMFISLGAFGGIVYLIVIGLTLFKALRLWTHTRSFIAMAVVGILIFSIMGWLKPGHYFVTPFLWFCIGSLDRLYTQYGQAESRQADPQPVQSPQVQNTL